MKKERTRRKKPPFAISKHCLELLKNVSENLQLLGTLRTFDWIAFSQDFLLERLKDREETVAYLNATLAKARGVYGGRKPTLSPEQVADLRERVEMGIPKAKIARDFKISRETVYQYIRSG